MSQSTEDSCGNTCTGTVKPIGEGRPPSTLHFIILGMQLTLLASKPRGTPRDPPTNRVLTLAGRFYLTGLQYGQRLPATTAGGRRHLGDPLGWEQLNTSGTWVRLLLERKPAREPKKGDDEAPKLELLSSASRMVGPTSLRPAEQAGGGCAGEKPAVAAQHEITQDGCAGVALLQAHGGSEDAHGQGDEELAKHAPYPGRDYLLASKRVSHPYQTTTS